MRAHLAAGGIVLGRRSVFGSTQDSELWLVRGDTPVAVRDDPYARRVFRDPHPLDDHPETLFDNGNGYRILLGSSGVEASDGAGTLLAPARTFDIVGNDLVGGVLYTFGKYRIETTEQPNLIGGADPSRQAPPLETEPPRNFAVATFNLENLYDFRDDPTDDCDFAGNPGCPGVQPPFDFVPESEAAYFARVAGLAQQIVDDLRSPDLLMVQEAEDQDVCHVLDGAMVCDAGDGHPDTLQDLTLAIAARGGPTYEAVLDRNGADARGIVAGFLYRVDRVELLPATPDDPLL